MSVPWVPDERRGQIIRLLETLNDGLPVKSRRDHSSAGFVHHAPARLSCPDCLANDRVTYGCETCGGRGYLEEMRERDPYAVDKVLPYGMTFGVREREEAHQRQMSRLDAQLAPPKKTELDLLEEANENPYPWERERALMFRLYDYARLVRALELLRAHDDGLSRAVHAAYVYGWVEPSAVFEQACDLGLRFIDVRMPDPIRAPAKQPHPALIRKARKHERRAA